MRRRLPTTGRRPAREFRSQLVAVTLCALFPLAFPLEAVEFHVDVAGDDRGDGTPEAPFATLARARDAVRAQKLLSPAGARLEIIIHGGIHRLTEPLVISPEDSGTPTAPVVYRAAVGARPILSGGVTLNGRWSRVEGDLWRLDLDPARGFHDLFVDGRRATRARTPNAGSAQPVMIAAGGGRDRIVLAAGAAREAWAGAPGVFVNVVPSLRFFNQVNDVLGVDEATNSILLGRRERHRDIDAGSWFFLEGARESLDEPGEWWLDAAGRCLLYIAREGEHPPAARFTAPVTDCLIHLRGDIETGARVEHVHLSGLCFEETARTFGHVEPRTQPAAALRLTNASHCHITNCIVRHAGDYGIWLHLDSCDNLIDANEIVAGGAGGVLLTSARIGYMDGDRLLTSAAAAAGTAPLRNTITRNHIHHCGLHRYYCSGIHLDSRPPATAFAAGNRISHNHLHHLPRNGIFAFRNQGGTVIECNRIEHTLEQTQDGGGIHVATMNPLAAPIVIANNIVAHAWGWCWRDGGRRERRIARGIYLDWCTSSATIRDNIVYDTHDGGLAFLGGDDNRFVNNIVIGDGTRWDGGFLQGRSLRAVDLRNIVEPDVSAVLPVLDPATGDFAPNPQYAFPPAFRPIDATRVGPTGTATDPTDVRRLSRSGAVVPHDADAGVTTTGAWEITSAPGPWGLYGSGFRRSTEGTLATIAFTLPIAADGEHDVRILFPAAPSHAARGQATIHHADGSDTMPLDQRTFGFWPSLGRFRFVAGQPARVELATAVGDGPVVVEAVGLAQVIPPAVP